MGKRTFLIFAVGIGLFAPLALAVGPEEHAKAWKQIRQGKPYEAAVSLVEYLRSAPGDDPKIADELVGPSQLLGFDIAFLLDWPERCLMLAKVLDPENQPADKLLIATLKSGMGLSLQEITPVIEDLLAMAKGDHQGLRVTALYILSDPYYFKGYPHAQRTTAEMVLAYPSLELTKCLLRMPIYRTVEKAKDKNLPNEMILKDVLLGGGRKEVVFAADSAIRDTLQDLPNLRVGDIKPGNTKAWGRAAREAGDWSSRYHALFMTRGFRFDAKHKSDIKAATVELAEKSELSPEVVLAQEWMVDYSQNEHDVKALRKAVDTLLAHDVLPCTPERNLYESDMKAVQEAAQYYLRFGHFAEAEKTYDALAKKYPGSMLQEQSIMSKDSVRANGLKAAETEWENVVSPLVHEGKYKEAATKLEEVVANTPSNALKIWCQAKISELKGK